MFETSTCFEHIPTNILHFSYMVLPWDKGLIHKVEFSVLKKWNLFAFYTAKIKIIFSLQSVI